MQNRFSQSEVVQRYYGFMVGFIADLLLFEFAKPGYLIHKLRIDEVLADVGAEIRVPARHAQFRADTGLRRALALEFKSFGKIVTDFYALGTSAFYALIEPAVSALGRSSRRTLSEICSEYDLDFEVVRFVVRRGWARSLTGNDLIQELVSRAYDIAGMPIRYSKKEDKTCFVIMPFDKPFREYYAVLYCPSRKRDSATKSIT